MILDQNQKKAIELFRPRGWRYMEHLPKDIHVENILEEGDDDNYSFVDVRFAKDDKDAVYFTVSVDDDWYLCEDGKLRQDMKAIAIKLYQNKVKDGKVVKPYDHIVNRAMESVAMILLSKGDKFEKVDD